MRNKLLCTFAILTLVATGAFAIENLPAATGTLTSQADTTIVVDTAEGQMTFLTDQTTEWIDRVNEGDTVLVRYDAEDNHALEVFKVYEKVDVTDQLKGERRAIFGTVTGSSPNELLIESNQGTVFVLRPDKLYPPLPVKNDKVALVYRIQEEQGNDWEHAIATDLAVLPDDFVLPGAGSTQVGSEPMVQPAAETMTAERTDPKAKVADTSHKPLTESKAKVADTSHKPMTESMTDEELERKTSRTTQMASLPQTASPLPLIGLLGALSLGGGIVLRRRNRK